MSLIGASTRDVSFPHVLGGNPVTWFLAILARAEQRHWIPAYAGMTMFERCCKSIFLSRIPNPGLPSKRQFKPRRQIHPTGNAAHFFLARGSNPVHRIVDGGGNQILGHFGVFGK